MWAGPSVWTSTRGINSRMPLDLVEKAFAELMGYLAAKSMSVDIEIEDITNDLAILMNTYIERKNDAETRLSS